MNCSSCPLRPLPLGGFNSSISINLLEISKRLDVFGEGVRGLLPKKANYKSNSNFQEKERKLYLSSGIPNFALSTALNLEGKNLEGNNSYHLIKIWLSVML